MILVESKQRARLSAARCCESASTECEGLRRLKKMWCLPNSTSMELLLSEAASRQIPSALTTIETEWIRPATSSDFSNLTKELVASTRATYPHHWPARDALGVAACSLRTRLPVMQPSSQDWSASNNRKHLELYLSCSKDWVSNRHQHSSMHVGDVAVVTAPLQKVNV